MSGLAAPFSREALEKLSDRKKRKLAIDCSDVAIMPDSQVVVVEDSQSGYRDLFGELIPLDKCSIKTPPKSKSAKKRPTSRKKKPLPEEPVAAVSPASARPPRVFIPTPKIMRIMKDAQAELYSLMGLNKSTSDASVVSNDSLNVSGVQDLLDSSITSVPDESKDNGPPLLVLEGVVAFVDYKLENDRSSIGIIDLLEQLGAKVEKTFNKKVTHVVFRDGYRKTYDTAIERKIPLVSARWVENSKFAKKILSPDDYPPIGIEKYTRPREITYKIPKSSNKRYDFLRPSNAHRDNLLRMKCDKLFEEVANLKKNSRYPITEEADCSIDMVITPVKLKTIPETSKEPEDIYRPVDIISIISDQLCKVLNTTDSPPDEKADELFFPTSLKTLRKYLTPNGNENRTPLELDSDLVKIEDRLNLNSQARQRLRKLLFPADKELLNLSVASDFPSPSPQKDRLSAPGRLTSIKKRKMQDRVLDELPQNKNIITDKNKLQEKTVEQNYQNKLQDKLVEQNLLQWKIPSCLRPKKTRKKINVHKEKDNLTQQTITSMFSRNSSVIFQTPKQSLASPVTLQTIACTGMTKCEMDIIEKSVEDLGQFTFHAKVTPSTTYLITKTLPNRTLNMVFAMAYGCIIVSENWVHESHKSRRWLSHEQYLFADLSKPVKDFQKRRQTFGALVTFHVFEDAGSIYISDSCQPPAKQLKRLVRACGGNCSSTETLADVVVGYTPRMRNNVNEKWILDCITQGSLLNKVPYLLTNDI